MPLPYPMPKPYLFVGHFDARATSDARTVSDAWIAWMSVPHPKCGPHPMPEPCPMPQTYDCLGRFKR